MPFAAKTSEKRTCPVPVSHARESSAARLRHSARTIREAPFAGGAELFEQRERPMSTYRGTDRRNGKSWASRLGKKGEDFRVRAPFLVSGDPPISVPRPKPDSDPISARRQTSRFFSAETTERPCRLTTDSLGRAKCRAKKARLHAPATGKHGNGGVIPSRNMPARYEILLAAKRQGGFRIGT